MGKIETASLTFLKDIPGFVWSAPQENNFVDKFVFEKLQQLKIAPSDLCSDEEFIRRVTLDVIGILSAGVVAYLAFNASKDLK